MKFWFFFFFSFLCFVAIGQQIKFKTYTINQGLSNNSVVDIENDVNGGLWIATWDGLNYFDGSEFVVYKHDIHNKNSIAGNYIVNIERDKFGTIWVQTDQGKLSKYIGNGKFNSFEFETGVVTKIRLSDSQTIVIDTGIKTYEYIKGRFIENKVPIVREGAYDTFKNIFKEKYPEVIVNGVLKDKQGNIWFATRRNGIYIIPNHQNNIQNKQIHHYVVDKYTAYSFNSNEINKLHIDLFDNVWLAHKDGGLSMAYKDSNLISQIAPHPIKFPHLPNESIRAITTDLNGKIWLGYYNKGLYYYDNKTKCYVKYIFPETEKNIDWERVRSLFTSSDGSVWVGTYAGLLRIYKETYQLYNAKTIRELPNNRHYSLYEDENKNIWISCWGGVAKFNLIKNKFETFKGQNLLKEYHIRNIKKYDRTLVLATEYNGVIFFDLENNSLEHITMSKGILGNSVYSVFKDKTTSNYWVASLGGVSVYHKTKGIVKNITEKDGLPSHMVYGLIDTGDKVWLSTTKGLAVIDKFTYEVKAFNPNEGWLSPEFSEGAYYQDPKGMMFFAGVKGLNYFNPAAINIKEYFPKIKLKVDGDENYPKYLIKEHANNDLSLKINTIVFPESQKKDVYYKLDGIDTSWKLLKWGVLKYNNLPSGSYDFYLKTSSEETPSSPYFTVKINKAFYETIWFYCIVTLVFMLSVLIIVWIRNKNNKKLKKKLEQKIIDRTKVIEHQKQDLLKANQKLDEKNKEVSQQKEQLLELHNSLKNEDFELEKFKSFVLSEFQEPVSKIIQASNKIEGNSKQKEKIINHAASLINLLSEWSYLDHVKDLEPTKKSIVNLFSVLKNILEKNKKVAQKNQVNFISHINKDITWVEIDILRFSLLMQYFFGDILKYANKDSQLNITITHQNNLLELQLISTSELLITNWDHVIRYSPYFKAVKTLLHDLNGSFHVQEEQDFVLTFEIPVFKMNKDFKQSEIISWKHMNQQELLNNGNKNILILSDVEHIDLVKQLLGNQQSNLLFESEISDVSSAIQQIDIDVLVFYQTNFTKELVGFFNKYKSQETQKKIPFVYISEEISYSLQEQSVEFGIDVVIQLPVSESYIQKKILGLIKPKENKITNQLEKDILKILTEENDIETSNDKLIKKSLEIIKKELSNSSFNVEMLIEELAISRVKCYRLFKEVLGKSPSDVISSLRFQKAAYLLKNKNLNISEISYECGFNDPKYFGKSFKKQFGMSPKAFKSQKGEA